MVYSFNLPEQIYNLLKNNTNLVFANRIKRDYYGDECFRFKFQGGCFR